MTRVSKLVIINDSLQSTEQVYIRVVIWPGKYIIPVEVNTFFYPCTWVIVQGMLLQQKMPGSQPMYVFLCFVYSKEADDVVKLQMYILQYVVKHSKR